MSAQLKFLLADDHPIFRRGLCDVIATDAGLQLAGQATNGEEALKLVDELRPDIAILDVHMPKLSGLKIFQKSCPSVSSAGKFVCRLIERAAAAGHKTSTKRHQNGTFNEHENKSQYCLLIRVACRQEGTSRGGKTPHPTNGRGQRQAPRAAVGAVSRQL